MSLTERKNAFLNVLSANLDKNIQTEIMSFWEENYSSKPQFGVSAFLDELYRKYDIGIKKGQLFKELSRATTRAGFENRSGDSSDTLTSSNPTSNRMIEESGLLVYQTIQDQFLAQVKPLDQPKIINAQIDGMKKQAHITAEQIPPLTAWLKRGKASMPNRAPLGSLKTLFNLGYVECCHLYGPVKADQMLNTALQKANGLPEAQLEPPVQFI